jgi:hypothetical protein
MSNGPRHAFNINCPGLDGDETRCGNPIIVWTCGDEIDEVLGCHHPDDQKFNLAAALTDIERVARERAEESAAARYYHESGGL